MNLMELHTLVLAASDIISTDMSSKEILSFVSDYYPLLSNMGEVATVQIPSNDGFKTVAVEGVGSVLVPYLEKNSAIIAEYQD